MLLANCYRNSLALAEKHGLAAIAFPVISTGIYHFPIERATRIALEETRRFLAENTTLEKITFICFSEEIRAVYLQVLRG